MGMRVVLGITVGVVLGLWLNTFLAVNQEVRDERIIIEESGYWYDGETAVSEEMFTDISNYTEYYKDLGWIERVKIRALDGGMVLVSYNFFSSKYYPELTQQEWNRSLLSARLPDLVLKFSSWFLAPTLLCLFIIFYPKIDKMGSQGDDRSMGVSP